MKEKFDWDLEQEAIDEIVEKEAIKTLCECLICQLSKKLGGE